MLAARARSESCDKRPFTKYRVILARYSAAPPARQTANGCQIGGDALRWNRTPGTQREAVRPSPARPECRACR